MESTAARRHGVTATGKAACSAAVGRPTVKAVTTPSVAYATAVSGTATVSVTTTIAYTAVSTAIAIATAISVAPTPVPVVPRPGADEEAADEPARSVITIGSAGVGIVVVVAPLAGRRWITVVPVPVPVANTHPDTNAHLSICRSSKKRCGNHYGAEQHEIS